MLTKENTDTICSFLEQIKDEIVKKDKFLNYLDENKKEKTNILIEEQKSIRMIEGIDLIKQSLQESIKQDENKIPQEV